jgi:signal transduction histidine kinase
LLAAFAITSNPTGRRRLAGLGLLGLVVVATAWLPGAGDGFVPVSLAMTVAAAAGWVWSGRDRRVAQLVALEDQLRSGEQAAVRLAMAERRQEIARELHDVVAHAMTVVCLHSAGARRAGPDEAATAARMMAEVTRGAMEQLRRALQELDPDDSPARFDPTGLVATARASGTPVAVHVHGRPRPVPGAVARTAERTLQEALTNTARHAPGAKVDVTVSWESDALVVDVQDRPPAAHVTQQAVGSGSGLIGLRERACSHGGTLEAGSTEKGFGVRVRLPLHQDSA